ncbi:MAG TPA: ABC transporter permease [Actinomycetes bacterium]|nr:ABC transporter permease [Actinomycetes bacterium]
MLLSPAARVFLRIALVAVLGFLYLPLMLVLVSSFNASRVLQWPPSDWTTHWWSETLNNAGARDALIESLKVASLATLVALILGTMISFAVARYTWFGRNSISFLFVLPIALPGIVTGVALQNAFINVLSTDNFKVTLGFWTVVIGHATFCIVIIFNNVAARLRRAARSLEEASMDLGASTFQTFGLVTFPQVRSAVLAGALLAFGLSFDEIIVTQFTAGPGIQTLPLWIYDNLQRPNQAPVVNVVAALVIVLSVFPVYIAQRLSDDPTDSRV